MSDAYLIYDGECPFCTQYVRMARLRAVMGELRLINARDGGPEVAHVRDLGYQLDEGFVLHMDGAFFHGADSLHRLALMSSRSGLFNRFTYAVFRNEARSRLLYPVLRAGRNMALRLLGRSPMGY
ncbi:DUF393 domain-containing protein [Roseobacter sp. YSTF-M11]|uniref:DUF393 domain-containing protein n=1 Tax=Roseobacter insulae TaxID=2859783 RepID=A0A9X1FWU3_9RHOB|nr:DCC1-like thiol-disulfide oxidoreductase family protein [Roseobacter insulae]MBW4709176.1 DUF393 domain-containing protein [Roseobacter insulae]